MIFPFEKKYKIRDLKTYTSLKWLYENKKNYRAVYDRYETNYIYAELSFYNKLFDSKDWGVKLQLKCFFQKENGASEQVCDLSFQRVVKRHEHIYRLREGWGNKAMGAFWKEGTYCWVAYINGTEVAETFFHIISSGKKYPSPSAYLGVQALTTFEGDSNVPTKEVTPLKVFSSKETQYIKQRIRLKNNLPQKEWYCEITAKYYDKSRLLVGVSNRLKQVLVGTEYFDCYFHWGSDEKGSWLQGDYFVEFTFLDTIIAIGHFSVGNEVREGESTVLKPYLFQTIDGNTGNILQLNAHIITSKKAIWINKLANFEVEEVIAETLSFVQEYHLTEKIKEIVNLSSLWSRTVRDNPSQKVLNSFNELLVDFINEI